MSFCFACLSPQLYQALKYAYLANGEAPGHFLNQLYPKLQCQNIENSPVLDRSAYEHSIIKSYYIRILRLSYCSVLLRIVGNSQITQTSLFLETAHIVSECVYFRYVQTVMIYVRMRHLD